MRTLLDTVPRARSYSLSGGEPVQRLATDGSRIFRAAAQPWRWRGVTAFQLLDRFAQGEDVEPFLSIFSARDYNLLRVFWYTPEADWHETAWDPAPRDAVVRFCRHVEPLGWRVELVLLTDDSPSRAAAARQLVSALPLDLGNLLLEIGNEPQIHKHIDTAALKAVCDASGYLYASGDSAAQHFGAYVTAHTARDGEWPRRAHDLLEYYDGGGPDAPTDPPHRMPCVADEPIRPDQAGFVALDFYAYAAACSLLGAGATFHFESGKFGRLPTDAELRCAEAFARGLTVFPPTAPLWAYRRPVEQSLRTYVVGRWMVRIRPTTPDAPEPGWVALDDFGICWRLESRAAPLARSSDARDDVAGSYGGPIDD